MQFNEPTFEVPQSMIFEIVAQLDERKARYTRPLLNAIEQLCQMQNKEKQDRALHEAIMKATTGSAAANKEPMPQPPRETIA